VRRKLAPPFAVAVATPADAADLANYERGRGRPDAEYRIVDGEFVVIARVRGHIVACTHILDPSWTRPAGMAGDLWIHDTHVARAFRGLGIGRAITSAAVDELHRRGAPRVRVAIRVENRRSQTLHESLGFARIGQADQHVLLQLSLANPKPLG
jgi:ribosomal protein S18 acetylase RimI-like enzyme